MNYTATHSKQVSLPDLSSREQELLQYIIQNFIVTASPVASKTLVEKHKLGISPATVRNTLTSLEKKGLLKHPHTSAGRVPTDEGYRYYVNALMQVSGLTNKELEHLDQLEDYITVDMDEAVKSASKLLGRLSNLLAVVVAPKLARGIFQKLELISLSSTRLMVVLTVESGLVKTISIEVESEIDRNELDKIAGILNERLSGIVLSEIPNKIKWMLSDYESEDKSGLIRMFIDSADTIFDNREVQNFHFGGVEYIALQPEFTDLSNYRSIVELVEDEDMIVHLFDDDSQQSKSDSDVVVRIGNENKLRQIERCSVVSTQYRIGNSEGTIGLVGPTRMNYPRMVALVEQLATRFNKASFNE